MAGHYRNNPTRPPVYVYGSYVVTHTMNQQFRVAILVTGMLCSQVLIAAQIATDRAPEFTHSTASEWINSPPLKLADFKGRVLLIDVWTFDCWNCYHSIPWLKDLEGKFRPKEVAILGVHSPELPHERDRNQVLAKVGEFGIHHPVMLDNDFSYWNALGNQYWPAFYVVDKQGRMRGKFVGETHVGDSQAKRIEALVVKLLAE